MIRDYRRSISVIVFAVCGIYFVALAQMPPMGGGGGYTPPAGGNYTPPAGGEIGDSYQPPADNGGGQDAFDNYPDTGDAYDFQRAVISKKPPKPKKVYLGISTLWQDPRGDIRRMTFAGGILDPHWRIGGTATDPVAQGTLTGKGSLWNIVVGLYTGFVRSNFISKDANWNALFYADHGAQRSELFNGKLYQEETSADADGALRKLGLLLAGKTLFGVYEGGSFFITDTDALPEAASGLAPVPIPRSKGLPIPTDKIIELLTKAGIPARDMLVTVAHAAARFLTPSQIFDRLGAYKKVRIDMADIEQKFGQFDFNDPNIDYDAVQALVDAYDADQKIIDYVALQLGKAFLFVRGGDWLTTGGPASITLMAGGIDLVPATLVSEVSGPFDFYTVQTVDGKDKLFAGTCTGKNDPTTGEQVVCVLRKPTATQSKAVLTANDAYLALVSQAHDALGSIESALFAPAE